MSKERAGKAPIEVFLEPGVVWKIGDREYVQRPLSIRGLSRVLGTISAEINSLVETPLFMALATTDLSNISTQRTISLLVSILAAVPDMLPRFLAAILDTPDVDYIAEHATPGQALKILETLWEQNEPEVLIRGFFGLGSKVRVALGQTSTTSE